MLRVVLVCILAAISAEAFVRREVPAHSHHDFIESIQKNIDMFRACVDQSMARAVDDVNEKHLQPIFDVIGDQINRVSKAFDDLTTPTKKSESSDHIQLIHNL